MSKSMFMINSLSSGYEYWKKLSFTVFETLHSGPGDQLCWKAFKVCFLISEHSELTSRDKYTK